MPFIRALLLGLALFLGMMAAAYTKGTTLYGLVAAVLTVAVAILYHAE